jgi:hypothetical protein
LDREVIATGKARLKTAMALWRKAAEVVFADVEATTDIRWAWQVTLHEDEEDWSAFHHEVHEPGVHVLSVVELPRDWKPSRKRLPFPQLWLEADKDATTLDVRADMNDAIGFVAERVQDWVIDDIGRAWPECPKHPHPADLGNLGDRPTWACPRDGQFIAEVGKLGSVPKPGVRG